MPIIDFARSFLTFRIDLEKKPPITVSHKPPFTVNNARIPIECYCEIIDKAAGGQPKELFLGVNCKTERVGVNRDIWTEPNADFVPLFSQDEFLAIKTWEHVGKEVPLYPPTLGLQSERQICPIAEAFDSLRIDVHRAAGERLEGKWAIIEAILGNDRLVARTRLENARYIAHLEYPVKTINASERDGIYQTDTGPVIYPDLRVEPACLLANAQLAFSAFNSPEWVEFLVRVPTPVSPAVHVYHYSRPVHLEACNEVYRLD